MIVVSRSKSVLRDGTISAGLRQRPNPSPRSSHDYGRGIAQATVVAFRFRSSVALSRLRFWYRALPLRARHVRNAAGVSAFLVAQPATLASGVVAVAAGALLDRRLGLR